MRIGRSCGPLLLIKSHSLSPRSHCLSRHLHLSFRRSAGEWKTRAKGPAYYLSLTRAYPRQVGGFTRVLQIDNPTGRDIEFVALEIWRPRGLQLARHRNSPGVSPGVVDSEPTKKLEFNLTVPGGRPGGDSNNRAGADFFFRLPASFEGPGVSTCAFDCANSKTPIASGHQPQRPL